MRKRLASWLSVCGFMLAVLWAGEAAALRRVALIVGNAKYEHAGVLANTLNDAHAIASVFRRAKFDVVDERDDLGVVAMKRAVRDFAVTASNADIAVIYYSGHGIEAAGANYLIPVDAKLANAYDVEDETLPLDRLLWATSGVKALSLVILDACRENPFLHAGETTPTTRGAPNHLLAEQATSANTLIAYAARAGSLSYDGVGPNSPFTTALVRHIAEPGLDIRLALGQVRDDVWATTGGRQEPFVYGSLGGGTVSLAPPSFAPSSSAAPSAPDTAAATAADYAFAERVGTADAWRAFLNAHRESGFYVDLARAQLDRVTPYAPEPTPSPSTVVAALPPPAPPPPPAKPAESQDPCQVEGARLAGLRVDPSRAAISAFAMQATCPALRPQLARLMESVGLAAPSTPTPTRVAARNPIASGCDAEAHELEKLRGEPDAAAAQALFNRLTCPALRPQLQRLMESLGVAVPPTQMTTQRALAPMQGSAPGRQAADCTTETEELARLRAQPDRKAARAFAAQLRCVALKPQAERLVESLGD